MHIFSADKDICGIVLNGIAGIYQQGILRAVLCNCGRKLGYAAGSTLGIERIVPWQELAMQIAGADDAQSLRLFSAFKNSRSSAGSTASISPAPSYG